MVGEVGLEPTREMTVYQTVALTNFATLHQNENPLCPS